MKKKIGFGKIVLRVVFVIFVFVSFFFIGMILFNIWEKVNPLPKFSCPRSYEAHPSIFIDYTSSMLADNQCYVFLGMTIEDSNSINWMILSAILSIIPTYIFYFLLFQHKKE